MQRYFRRCRLPENEISGLLSIADRLDEPMRLNIEGQLFATYLEASQHVAGATRTLSFRSPFDEFDEKESVTIGIARLLLAHGIKARSGNIFGKGKLFEAKVKELSAEVIQLFVPDFTLFDPHAKMDGLRETIVP